MSQLPKQPPPEDKDVMMFVGLLQKERPPDNLRERALAQGLGRAYDEAVRCVSLTSLDSLPSSVAVDDPWDSECGRCYTSPGPDGRCPGCGRVLVEVH